MAIPLRVRGGRGCTSWLQDNWQRWIVQGTIDSDAPAGGQQALFAERAAIDKALASRAGQIDKEIEDLEKLRASLPK